MKRVLSIWAICCALLFPLGCSSSKQEILQGVKEGMYDGSNQVHQMEEGQAYPTPEYGEDPPTYEQYERERQEITTPPSGK